MKISIVSSILITFFFSSLTYAQGTIQVTFTDLESNNGQVIVCLFDQDKGFPGKVEQAHQAEKVTVSNRKAHYTFSDLPLGTYAVSVMHDENDNGEIERNFIGMPKEKVGISKLRSNRSRPSFSKASFTLTQQQPNARLNITPFN